MSISSHTKLVHHLLQLQRERATGALTVTADEESTIVYFEGGRAVFADSPAVSQTLGRLLLESGVITHQQYTIAIGELRRSVARDRTARLGGVLVNLGFTTVEAVQDALVKQVERRIAGLLQHPEHTWTWADGDGELADKPRYPMRVEPMILDGVRLFYSRADMTQALQSYRGGFLVLRAPAELIVRCFSLRAELAAVVASIDGTLITESWLMQQPSEDAWPLATALAMTGVLAVMRAEPSREVVVTEARKNPSLAPPGNTGVFEVPKVQPVRMPADPIFATPNAAPAPAAKPPSPEQLARLEAESACRIGIDLMHAEEFEEAETHFSIAKRAMPRVLEYQLYWSWVLARTKGPLEESSLGELEQLAATTSRQDSLHAFPPYVYAHIALARGDEDTAIRFFKVADHRGPDNEDAGNQLRRLGRKKR
jgi:hypothetical protein